MNDEQYFAHCRAQLAEFASTLSRRTESLPAGDQLRDLAEGFKALADCTGAQLYEQGVPLVTRLFTHYPDFAPTLPRELLWFLGGDCLHYMPDDEIALYQQLDEMRHAATVRGETLDLRTARAKLLKLQ